MRQVGVSVLAASFLAGLPVNAHHSVAAGFDLDTEISVTGTIVEMEFINPHARLFLEVQDDNGAVETWTAWFTSANNLMRRGWRPTDLPVGETVTVTGFPARDGSPQTYGGETLLADGRTLFGGNAPGQR
ncbi:MAG: DUF6152 family protein [Gammaproteobacteria bacterium]|nr:DUF6152 family protein [Gammaproteobacteria bacterium]MDH3507554.1 DUF6152 family protein [Gammaproteobacteria bacterium]